MFTQTKIGGLYRTNTAAIYARPKPRHHCLVAGYSRPAGRRYASIRSFFAPVEFSATVPTDGHFLQICADRIIPVLRTSHLRSKTHSRRPRRRKVWDSGDIASLPYGVRYFQPVGTPRSAPQFGSQIGEFRRAPHRAAAQVCAAAINSKAV